MPTIVHVVLRGVTKEQYDAVRAEAGWLERRPTGGLGHLTWWQGGDCYNVDAWENEGAFQAFVEQRLAPAMARVGTSVVPEVTFFPAHELYLPEAMTVVAGQSQPANAR